MAVFYDRRLNALFDGLSLSPEDYPRHEKARIRESAPVRRINAWVALRGGHTAPDGDTVHDVDRLYIRLGFEHGQYSDQTLATGNCVLSVASQGMSRDPKQGDAIWIGLGVDPANFITVFRGHVENVKEGPAGRSFILSCFDSIRRLQEFPFAEPSDSTDLAGAYETLSGGDEDGRVEAVRFVLDSLLSAGDVLAPNGTGILQYPTISNERTTLFDELSDLLRSAQLLAYLSPGGELMVTYSDGNPIWATIRQGDLGDPPNMVGRITPGKESDFDDTPFRSSVALWPLRHVQRMSAFGTHPDPSGNELLPFRFSGDNVISAMAIESTLVITEVRSRTTPESNLRDFIDLSALQFDELETLQFSQMGEGSMSNASMPETVAEYGLRYRPYSLGGLAEVPRGTQSAPGVEFGRYSLDRVSFSDAQVRQRGIPHQRIELQSPGILSLLPFEIVEVDMPDEGFQGLYMIEGRRMDVSSGGFRSTDILRKVDVPDELVTLDVRG